MLSAGCSAEISWPCHTHLNVEKIGIADAIKVLIQEGTEINWVF